MRLGALELGYYLGHHPVPMGGGDCEREGCPRTADRAIVTLRPPTGLAAQPRGEVLIVFVCWPCADAAERVIDGKEANRPKAPAAC